MTVTEVKIYCYSDLIYRELFEDPAVAREFANLFNNDAAYTIHAFRVKVQTEVPQFFKDEYGASQES